MEAKVFLTGNLGNDAQVTNFSNGNAVIEFSVATNQYYTDKNGEAQQKTSWHDCKRFVRQVNQAFIDKLSKGASLTLAGTLKYEEFAKEVTRTKSINIRKAYIEVAEIALN
jgi:single-strand DNA-binding protein